MRVFVCFDQADSLARNRIADDLMRSHSVWYEAVPSDPDTPYFIQQCDAFTFLLSRASLKSGHCANQLREARRFGKIIVWVKVRRGTPDPLPGMVKPGEHLLDLGNALLHINQLRNLLNALETAPDYREYIALQDVGVAVAVSSNKLEVPLPTERTIPFQGWNPLDQIRLLWWLLVEIQGFLNLRNELSEEYIDRALVWLVHGLMMLPLALIIVGLTVGTLPGSRELAAGVPVGVLLVPVLAAWFGAGVRVTRQIASGMVVLCLCCLYVIFQADIAEISSYTDQMPQYGVVFGVYFLIALVSAGVLGLSRQAEMDVSIVYIPGMAFIADLIFLMIVLIKFFPVIDNWMSILLFLLIGFSTIFITQQITHMLTVNLRRGRASPSSQILLVILVFAETCFLIYALTPCLP